MDCFTCSKHCQLVTCTHCTHVKIIHYFKTLKHLYTVLNNLKSRAIYLHQIALGVRPNIIELPNDLIHLHLAKRKARNKALRVLLNQKLALLQTRDHWRSLKQTHLTDQLPIININERKLKRVKALLDTKYKSEITSLYLKLKQVHLSTRSAWQVILPELFRVFHVSPVQNNNNNHNHSKWTIFGETVPLDLDITNIPEDKLNATLGTFAKLTAMIASYLAIPLPFDLQLKNSQTTIDLHYKRARNGNYAFAQLNTLPNSIEPLVDNLLPIYVGHNQGIERTSMGLAMLVFQVTTLASRCNIQVPTIFISSSSSKRRKCRLAPLDVVGLLIQTVRKVLKDGVPDQLSARPSFLNNTIKDSRIVGDSGEVTPPSIPFHFVLSAISRTMYRDESKLGFRILKKTPNVDSVYDTKLPMSETGILVPPPPLPETWDSDDDDDSDEGGDQYIMDTTSSFISINHSTVFGMQESGILLNTPSISNRNPSPWKRTSSNVSRSLMVRSILAAVDVGPPPPVVSGYSSVTFGSGNGMQNTPSGVQLSFNSAASPSIVDLHSCKSRQRKRNNDAAADILQKQVLPPTPSRQVLSKSVNQVIPPTTTEVERTHLVAKTCPSDIQQPDIQLDDEDDETEEEEWELCDDDAANQPHTRRQRRQKRKHQSLLRTPCLHTTIPITSSSSSSGSSPNIEEEHHLQKEELDDEEEDIELVDGIDLDLGHPIPPPPPPILSTVWDFGIRALSSSYQLAVHATTTSNSHNTSAGYAIMTNPEQVLEPEIFPPSSC